MKLILLAKNAVQTTEIIFYVSMIATILILLMLLIPIALGEEKQTSSKKKTKPKEKDEKNPKQDQDIVEIFDYLGTKIIHENGIYTVNDHGKVNIYNSWNELPTKYQKMVKELDNRSLQKEADSYFLETINGVYHLTFPDGTQKKYKSLNDIPAYIRKTIGK